MTASRFTLWLRSHGDALVNRCAKAIQRRRMRRAEAQLPPAAREKAAFWRTLYLARNARRQRECEARHHSRAASAPDASMPQEISKAEVLAAIARSRASREARLHAAQEQDGDTR